MDLLDALVELVGDDLLDSLETDLLALGRDPLLTSLPDSLRLSPKLFLIELFPVLSSKLDLLFLGSSFVFSISFKIFSTISLVFVFCLIVCVRGGKKSEGERKEEKRERRKKKKEEERRKENRRRRRKKKKNKKIFFILPLWPWPKTGT